VPEGAPPDIYGAEHSEQSLYDADSAVSFARRVWSAVVHVHHEQEDRP
jgi:flagellar biosynthesis regulator FlaF